MEYTPTQFPNIYPTTGHSSTETEVAWSYAVAERNISFETLVLSWAALLQAYTGDEQPVFVVNRSTVKANIGQKSFAPVPVEQKWQTDETSYTAICINGKDSGVILETDNTSVAIGKCSLSVGIDFATGAGDIRSQLGILPEYLQQIALQLGICIQKYTGLTVDGEMNLNQNLRLSIANPEPRELPGPAFLHQLAFHHQQRDAPALEFLSVGYSVQSLSFYELDCLSTQLAQQIAQAFDSPRSNLTGRIVPVLLSQSVELYITWLAVLKSGAAFCPLSTDVPEDRICFILNDVSADVIVTNSAFKDKVANGADISLILVDKVDLQAASSIWQEPTLAPEDVAYVMYTSGSTGRPKGVAISHRAATQSVLAHNNLIPPFKRFLQFASPTFDVSVFEIFFPWFRGATLIGSERSNMLFDLPRIISKMQVDAAELTPTVAGELLRNRQSVPSLTVLLTIGEMLTKRVVEEFGASTMQDGILYGMYGPTEATIHCTAAPNFQSESRVNLIGRPFETVSAFVISLEDSPDIPSEPVTLPIGQIGELAVGGPQLAIGYINRPTENLKAFIRSKKYGRLYRTGDKARLLPNGEIECFGRVSTGQIKLRGQRVELGEIESIISMAPRIRSTVVGVVGGILIAWIIADHGYDIRLEDIKGFCRGKLPNYMVPGDFLAVDAFPRLESGKVDRKALEAEYLTRQKEKFTKKRTFRDSLEEKITEIVESVVGTSVDSLSAAGLDSLKGIKLAAKLREIGINLDVAKLLSADSVSDIWNIAQENRRRRELTSQTTDNTAQTFVEAAFSVLGSEGLLSRTERVELCSDIQVAMLSESLRDSKAYCNWIELKFIDGLELAKIKAAFKELIHHNEMLRSAFLSLDTPDYPFCQVTWNRDVSADPFQETTCFDYEWNMANPNLMVPFKLQFIQDKTSVRALLHLHHAIYDGWSWELMLNDLQAALDEKPLTTRTPYSAVVKHSITTLSSDAARSTSYWATYMQGVTLTNFPNFHGRNGFKRSSKRLTRTFDISPIDLETKARSMSISRQTFFQSSLAYILSSYLDTQDVIFGTVFSGRTVPVAGIESIIGPCIRVLPNRVNLSWVRTVADLLNVVQRDNRKALDYGNLSLRDIKKAAGIEGSSRLFDCIIVWQETLGESSGSWTSFEQTASADYLEFPLTIELEPINGRIKAAAIFDQSIFPEAQVHLLLEQVEAIADIFVRSPKETLHSVNAQLPSTVLSIENSDFVHLDNLPHLAYHVEQIAVDEPGRNAIEFVHTFDPDTGSILCDTLTYGELNSRSNRLAHYLLSSGISSGDLVAIILDKSIELYVAILAVIKIGVGYVPLTPVTPFERIRAILNETVPKTCVVDSGLLSQLKSLDWLSTLEPQNVNMEQYSDANIILSHHSSNISYVVYTSGSTGKPKGVAITHHNLQSNIATLAEIYPVKPDSKILQACSQAFDVSVFEIFFAWNTGMTLCSATNDIMFRDIEAVIRNMHITHLSLTPTVAALIRPENVPEVGFLVTAGEGLTAKVHREWAGNGLYQGYGPCETTNICTVKPNVSQLDDLRNIGKPFKNTSAFVISDSSTFTILPRGSVGEFCFGGDQVGKEYIEQADLTKEKFIEHPKFGRLYRSGDFGRLLADGSLMFTGRRDDQVKLRGQRIELGEINSTILCHAQAQDCMSIIIGGKDRNERQQLVSFFVLRSSRSTENEVGGQRADVINAIFEELSAKLPSYMVPSALIPVDEIPMTTVKKIDAKQLTARFRALTPDDLQKYSRERGLPVTDTLNPDERQIAQIISQATHTSLGQIRLNTSLFSIGLDSISAIYMAKKLRDSGFGQVDVSLILRHSSVGELSKQIGKAKADKGRPLTSESAARNNGTVSLEGSVIQEIKDEFEAAGHRVQLVIPCTALQEAMLSRTVSHGKTAYWNHILFELYGDIETFREVMQQMVTRHDILRTSFVSTKDARFSFAQVILEEISLPFSMVETTEVDLEISKQKSNLAQQNDEKHKVPYALTMITDVRTGHKKLLLSIHHAIHDGEAMSLLFKEIEKAYEGKELLPAPQFHQFVDHIMGGKVHEEESFWSNYLNRMCHSHLCPQVAKTRNSEGPEIGIVRQELGISFMDFERLCHDLSATPLSVFQASWARLLSAYIKSSDICFGTVLSGRTTLLEGVEHIIGPCFNVLPIRVKLLPTALNTDVIKAALEANADILAHQHASLRQIQKKFSPNGRLLFDSIVLFQRPATELDSRLWKLVSEEGEMDFPVILEIVPSTTSNSVSILLHTDSSLVSHADSQIILKDFIDTVMHTIRYPWARSFEGKGEGHLPSIAQVAREYMVKESKYTEASSTLTNGHENLSDDEHLVRNVMSELSKYDPQAIRHDTTIFQLGLDSINAVQISRMLRDKGYTVSAADILERPSLGQIAELLRNAKSETSLNSFQFDAFQSDHKDYVLRSLDLQETDVESIRPCSPAQLGMLADFVKSNGDLYCNRLTLKIKEDIDISRLRDAWSTAMARHEMLRTGFIRLKDPKFPFAMVTYTAQYATLQWIESSERLSEKEYHDRRRMFHEKLHMPQWQVSLRHLPSTIEVELMAMHAIYDAQSLELILSDVVNLYRGLQMSPPVPITPILGHILTAASSVSPDTDSFWSRVSSEFQLTKFPNLTPFNVRDRGMTVSSQPATKSLAAINEQCRALGVSLQAAGQAAYARLLANYTGNTNVSFGVVLSGRDVHTNAEDAVFPCLVTLPFQCHVQGSNKELILSVMKTDALLVKHQFTPLSRIQRMFQQDSPLIDTVFVYQKLARGRAEMQFWDVVDDDARVDYPLSIELIPEESELVLRLTCRNDAIPQPQTKMILRQLDGLLLDSLFNEESNCALIPDVQPELLSVTPAKQPYIPSPVSLLHEYVEKTTLQTPHRIALEFASSVTSREITKQTWTYLELNQMGNRVARLLQSLNLRQSSLIAICFDKCPQAYFAILGILKSGHAYVALDPTAPLARKQFIIEDSGARVVLYASDKNDDLQQLTGTEVIAMDMAGLLDGISSDPPVLSKPIDPQDTCYCLYTSGTTGTPKGCEITHENAVQAMQAFTRLFSPNWNEDSKWLQFASFHFDVSVLEQYWSWSMGICVTSCPRDVLFQDLPGTIDRLQITHIDLTPSLAKLVTPEEVPSLCKGVFITGGEALKQEILDAWGKHRVIYNGYGPTEVTIGCTMLPRMDENSKSSNIGPQFDNVGSYVLQPGTNVPVLRGCMGELCVSGVLVGRGYINRPELTQEKFQYLDGSKRERFYRTGDLVRILYDDSFQFNGRIDDQVKLRGQRLELGEINSVIQEASDNVSEVTTLVTKHPTQQKEQLVAFVSRKGSRDRSTILETTKDDDVNEFLRCIKRAAQDKLPGYMVPTHIIPVVSLPLTPNNKVDAKALKTFFSGLSSEELQNLTLLSNENLSIAEKEVQNAIRILAEYAIVEPAGLSSNTSIFDVGLDSISVIGLAQHFRDAGYQNAKVSVIMRNPTVAGIAASLEKEGPKASSVDGEVGDSKQKLKGFAHENTVSAAEKIERSPEEIENVAPCTALQEGMIARFLESSRNLYCSSFRFELKPETDTGKLRQAWSETQANVQLLRLRMIALADGYAQVVLKDDQFPWSEMTVANDQEVDAVAGNEWQAWCSQLKDLTSTLWCLVLIKSCSRRLLCLNIFHALYDGNSLPLLLEQVSLRYHERKVQENAPSFMDILPYGPLRVSSQAKVFWEKHLVHAPDDRVFPIVNDAPCDTITLTNVLKEVSGLEQIKASLQVTENAIFHACWLLTLHEHFSVIPCLGIVVSGRALDIPGVESVVGPLFNTIPSYIPLHHLRTKADLIKACHQYHVSILPFQHTPLRDINKWTRRGTRNPLFEILFVFQKEHGHSSPAFSEHIWTEINSGFATADFPLSLEVMQMNGSVVVTLASQSHAVSEDTANALLSTFASLCKDIRNNHTSALPNKLVSSGQDNRGQEICVQRNIEELGNNFQGFDWTPSAMEIRNVVAALAEVDVALINPTTSIFEFGLDSIDAIKLSSRLKSRGFNLSVSSIMKLHTISKMSEALSRPVASSKVNSDVSLIQIQEEITNCLQKAGKLSTNAIKVLPLAALQESMVAEMIASGYQHYYGVEVFEVADGTNFSKLLTSWKTVIDTHDILRTSFVEIEDPQVTSSFAQVVDVPNDQQAIQVVDLGERSIGDFIQSSIYSSTRPEFAIYGVRKGDKRYIVLAMAHALYDGWSLDLLHTDVEKSYYGEDVTRPAYEPILESILNDAGDKDRQFWLAALKGFKPRKLPCGKHPGGDKSTLHRAEVSFDVPSETIKKFCRDHGITVQALTVTTWTIALASIIEALDVGFGLVLSGRSHADADEVMFPTMNTVVFRAILHGTRLEMLKYIQGSLNALIEYQHYPLRKVSGDIAAGSLFDTLFIYQKRPSSSTSRNPLYQSISGTAHTGSPLSVEMELMSGSMICRLAARDDLFGMKDATDILDRVAQVFLLITSEPQDATVDFTDTGMSICGRPSFRESHDEPEVISGYGEASKVVGRAQSWSDTELKIRQVLSAISGVPADDISKDSTLFHLGLDSISAIKVCSLLRKQSIDLPVSAMLKAGSIAGMAAVAMLENRGPQPDISSEAMNSTLEQMLNDFDIEKLLSLNKFSADDVKCILLVTAGQMYCLARNAQDPQQFYANFYYKADISRDQLSHAWELLVAQLPILRTGFIDTGVREKPWLQVILKQLENPVQWHETIQDPRFQSPPSRSITVGPVSLHAVETAQGVIINLRIHHALYDAVGLSGLIDRLSRMCTGVELQADTGAEFAKFIIYQNISSPLEVRKKFWKTYLAQTRPQLLKNTNLRQNKRISVYRSGLVENLEAIESTARRHGLSFQSLFMAVYAKIHCALLSEAHNEADNNNSEENEHTEYYVLGVYLANRGYPLEGLQKMISPTLNMLPLRIALSSRLIESAYQIQRDLHEISRVEHSGASLLEINGWTGARIDTFVNFLRLPDSVSDENDATTITAPNGNIRFTPLQLEDITHGHPAPYETRGVDGPEASSQKIVVEEKEEAEKERVYMDSMDIEAAVRDGKLDIGVFGPESLLSQEKAEEILSRLRRELGDVSLHL
ncbi:nonribosomal siderophore peptide synthase SidC [Talaromyces stipitatus ATCC 10500]|uniref:Nonribosomal peptide synthetase sidC n=1 Tax=Talaromyces stipitatus (strain ATCC 10500 / CBS 375.48 / QM 6759 / NRRL 1006) TaxID=441959 RepID=B8M109_TALSN|nr:nonribosomal siderophore peptide synthase SidC [Talaromyces stipitatus ATCC 10500]EED21789.1 nonribosomal siderophore peptide synthase SidC [Talaromyces stipitatus ATCC 10500]